MLYIQQLDETDCGAACLAMIASFYNLHKSIISIRSICGTDKQGTNLRGLLTAAKNLGFSAHALKGDKTSLTSDLPFPFIAHVAIQEDEKILLHYVVVNRIRGNKIEIWDPNVDKRKYVCSIEDFSTIWTGYTIFLFPDRNFLPSKDTGNLLLKFLPIIKPYKKTFIYAIITSILLVLFGILSTLYTRYIVDEVLFSQAKFTLGAISVGMIIVVILQTIIEAIRKHLLVNFSFKVNLNLMISYFTQIFNLPLSFFDSRKTGEILSRLQDINKIQEVLSQTVVSAIIDTAMIVIIVPVLWVTNRSLFFIVLFSIPFSAIIMLIYSKLYRKQFRKVMTKAADTEGFLVETVNGAMTIKAMTAEEKVCSDYEKYEMKVIREGIKSVKLQINQSLFSSLIKQVSSIVIFWVGSYFIINGEMSIGALISFSTLSSYFTNPLERLVNIQSDLQESYVAADRLGEILELESEKTLAFEKKLIKPNTIKGKIEFKNVSFRYGCRDYVCENLSFCIEPGEKVAFVGTSGSGKTTLAKLIMKFYEVEQGQIFIDDYDIRDIDTNYLRSRTGYVPQDVNLFSGTIADNISLRDRSASLEDIVEAATIAGANDFIEKLPNRYNTILGEHGMTLSGGERQRLALARAIIGETDILVLDEATSNLDTVSENYIKNVLENFDKERKTTIYIAHRLSTIKKCDKIFVIDNGGIVQMGTHDALLLQDGIYKKLWGELVV